MRKKITKNYITDIPQYGLGGWLKENAGAVGTVAGVGLGALGSVLLPGVGTMAGMAAGQAIGTALGGSIQANNKEADLAKEKKRLEAEQLASLRPAFANISPKSMYGIYAKGGDIEGEVNPIINIEKGELAIKRPSPNMRSGQIVKEFVGKNPITGKEYEPHASKKTKEPVSNYVPTEMVKDELQADYIISKKYAKKYKDASKRRDQFTLNSIIRNIDAETELGKDQRNLQMKKGGTIPKYENGGGFDLRGPRIGFPQPFVYTEDQNQATPNWYNRLETTSPMTAAPTIQPMSITAPLNNVGLKQSSVVPQIGTAIPTPTDNFNPLVSNAVLAATPGLINLTRGLFEKPSIQKPVKPVFNPYEGQALSKLSGRISSKPAIDEMNRQRNYAAESIRQNTPTGSVLRSNLQGLFGTAANSAGNTINQTRQSNLDLDARQGQAMMNAGNQRVDELNKARATNLQLDQLNLQSRTAKDNMLYAGLSDIPNQMLQLRKNQDALDMEAFKMMLLQDTFGTSQDLYNQPKYAKYLKRLGIKR